MNTDLARRLFTLRPPTNDLLGMRVGGANGNPNSTAANAQGGHVVKAHPSRGKPKYILMNLTASKLLWKSVPKNSIGDSDGAGSSTGSSSKSSKSKASASTQHELELSKILFISLGKRTPPLQHPNLAGVHESKFFSLLTKEGSLDIEAVDWEERETMVRILQEVLEQDRRVTSMEEGRGGGGGGRQYDDNGGSRGTVERDLMVWEKT
jgi:hypothetical protein